MTISKQFHSNIDSLGVSPQEKIVGEPLTRGREFDVI